MTRRHWLIDPRNGRSFVSDQFHESLPFHFAPGYENRRVNLTLSLAIAGAGGWRLRVRTTHRGAPHRRRAKLLLLLLLLRPTGGMSLAKAYKS